MHDESNVGNSGAALNLGTKKSLQPMRVTIPKWTIPNAEKKGDSQFRKVSLVTSFHNHHGLTETLGPLTNVAVLLRAARSPYSFSVKDRSSGRAVFRRVFWPGAGSAGGDAHWSLEWCCRVTFPTAANVQSKENDVMKTALENRYLNFSVDKRL